MLRAPSSSRRALLSAAALAGLFCSFPRPAAAQAVVKVSDTINLKFGFLLQPQADWTQDASSGEYQKNLFIRRVRLMVGGQLTPKVTFFFETDDPNLGKSVAGTKTISTGFIVQDAYLEWKARDEFALDAGLMFIPLCRNCYTGAATLLPIDYGAASFLHGGPTRSVVGRDTGFMARGYLAKNRLEYRLGAFQGFRDALSSNGLRSAGHLQYTFFDTETGFFTAGTYLAKKKVLTVGGGFDAQSNYKAFAGDLFFDRPVGAGGAFTLEGDFIHYDGGSTFPDLPKQNDWLAQAGYLFAKAKVMPWVKVEGQKFSHDADSSKDLSRYQVGLSYFYLGQNTNVKVGYGRVDPKAGRSTNLFTVQFQIFYF
jgi:Phosphate-selective porin O and P